MIVIVEDEVFSSPQAESLALGSLFHLGFTGQHRIQTDPLYGSPNTPVLDRWLATLTPSLREQVVLALEIGLEEEASGIPSDLAIRVAVLQRPDWDSVPPRLPLSVALPWLQRPLRLLLENRHNDGAFLRTVAPPLWRARFLDYLDKGWIEFDHGGGLSNMQALAALIRREDAMRLWSLFDSDAREPERPSAQSEAFHRACVEAGIAHHQLRRRHIESYLPVKALQAWAYLGPRSSRKARRETADAFASMQPTQRHHYNMKGGFQRDRVGILGIPDLFGAYAEDPRLQSGFEENIAALFHEREFRVQEEWLVRDDQRQETSEILQAIFRRL